jgi:NADH-quinone oxidoreductase subunit M
MVLAAIAGLTIIFGAVYMLRMYKNVMQGTTNNLTIAFADIHGSEKLVLGIICALIIIIGVYPQPLLHISEASVTNLVQTIAVKVAGQ